MFKARLALLLTLYSLLSLGLFQAGQVEGFQIIWLFYHTATSVAIALDPLQYAYMSIRCTDGKRSCINYMADLMVWRHTICWRGQLTQHPVRVTPLDETLHHFPPQNLFKEPGAFGGTATSLWQRWVSKIHTMKYFCWLCLDGVKIISECHFCPSTTSTGTDMNPTAGHVLRN